MATTIVASISRIEENKESWPWKTHPSSILFIEQVNRCAFEFGFQERPGKAFLSPWAFGVQMRRQPGLDVLKGDHVGGFGDGAIDL